MRSAPGRPHHLLAPHYVTRPRHIARSFTPARGLFTTPPLPNPRSRGTLGRAAYTFSRLYPYAFATNAYLDMSEVLFAAALTLSVACALASRACAADGHEDECTGGSALQGGQPPPAADAAAWRQRRRRWRVAWQLRWAQAHRFFSISARQLMSVVSVAGELRVTVAAARGACGSAEHRVLVPAGCPNTACVTQRLDSGTRR